MRLSESIYTNLKEAKKPQEYKSNKVYECPVCGNSGCLTYGSLTPDDDSWGPQAFYPWTCDECGARGGEYYSMDFVGHRVEQEDGEMIDISDEIYPEE